MLASPPDSRMKLIHPIRTLIIRFSCSLTNHGSTVLSKSFYKCVQPHWLILSITLINIVRHILIRDRHTLGEALWSGEWCSGTVESLWGSRRARPDASSYHQPFTADTSVRTRGALNTEKNTTRQFSQGQRWRRASGKHVGLAAFSWSYKAAGLESNSEPQWKINSMFENLLFKN